MLTYCNSVVWWSVYCSLHLSKWSTIRPYSQFQLPIHFTYVWFMGKIILSLNGTISEVTTTRHSGTDRANASPRQRTGYSSTLAHAALTRVNAASNQRWIKRTNKRQEEEGVVCNEQQSNAETDRQRDCATPTPHLLLCTGKLTSATSCQHTSYNRQDSRLHGHTRTHDNDQRSYHTHYCQYNKWSNHLINAHVSGTVVSAEASWDYFYKMLFSVK